MAAVVVVSAAEAVSASRRAGALASHSGAARGADASRVFDLSRGRPTSIVVTRSTEPPAGAAETSAMLQTLAGVIGVVPARDWNRLRTMVRAGRVPDSLEGATLVGVMHLRGAETSKRVEILRLSDGTLVASEIDPLVEGGEGAAAVLPPEFAAVMAGWDRYQGGFGATETPTARNVDMAHPYVPAAITFDEQTLGDRFLNGGRTNLRGAARDLETSTLWVRLPAGYDPRRPAGLIVWIDPMASGQPPEFMHPAADAMNFIIVGAADASNDRYVSDRHQLEFDAMTNAMVRYHIDPTRVYASGVSGGGRVSCMYWACFPEIFSGAVAIVGTSAYKDIPMGNGAHMARGFLLPDGVRERLRKQRLAAVSGPPDFNFFEIDRTVRMFDSDGFDAKLFEYADMGHEFPRPERFTEALEWVDEPWANTRKEAEDRAVAMLEGFHRREAGDPIREPERAALVRITQIAPWSEAAWEAAALLGFGTAEGAATER